MFRWLWKKPAPQPVFVPAPVNGYLDKLEHKSYIDAMYTALNSPAAKALQAELDRPMGISAKLTWRQRFTRRLDSILFWRSNAKLAAEMRARLREDGIEARIKSLEERVYLEFGDKLKDMAERIEHAPGSFQYCTKRIQDAERKGKLYMRASHLNFQCLSALRQKLERLQETFERFMAEEYPRRPAPPNWMSQPDATERKQRMLSAIADKPVKSSKADKRKAQKKLDCAARRPGYTKRQIERAAASVFRRRMTYHQAAEAFHVPFGSIFPHVAKLRKLHGKRWG